MDVFSAHRVIFPGDFFLDLPVLPCYHKWAAMLYCPESCATHMCSHRDGIPKQNILQEHVQTLLSISPSSLVSVIVD